MKRQWEEYNRSAEFDSLILSARPYFYESLAASDTVPVLSAGIFMAQSFIFLEQLDSARHYADIALRFMEGYHDYRLEAMLNNILAIYAIKSDLDYSSAMYYFKKEYDLAAANDDTEAQLMSLNNIANMFYFKSDEHGLEYAEKALSLSSSDTVDVYYKTISYLSMSQMTFLAGEADMALSYLAKADSLAEANGYSFLRASISLNYAGISEHQGRRREAAMYYERTLESLETAEPGVAALLYLNYGSFCEEGEDYAKAIELYKQGISLSYRHRNMLLRSELLHRLSDIYYKTGDMAASFSYSRQYSEYIDSVSLYEREKELNAILLSYREVEHRNEIQEKELVLLKSRRKNTYMLFGLAFAAILTVSALLLYLWQKKMYKTLALKYQQYIKRFDAGVERAEASADSGKPLFDRVDQMMHKEKIYKEKDLTLDKLAEKLCTNRTYLSRAINQFSGMSFVSYVNMYRVREAASMISDNSQEMLIKQIADEVGFKSVTVFSRVFQKETGLTPNRYKREAVERPADINNS